MVRWGLVPYWTKGETPKFSSINAAVEKLETAPTWRGSWQRARRCIIPANGFYEWHLGSDGKKHPYLIGLKDQPLFRFAGLWDASQRENGEVLRSCAIVTMPANDFMRHIHNTGNNPFRMPALLRAEDHAAWLGGTADEARRALLQYPQERLQAHPVSTRVNSPRNNDPQLLAPALDEQTANV